MDDRKFGKYFMRARLGGGSGGVVYEGWDPAIGRRVAIKTARRPEGNGGEAAESLARFRREAQAAGRLSHPNIVGVFDYGETEDSAYIVMEFVAGRSLKAILDDGERLPPPEILRVMSALLAGLQYCHDAGVVHRDIKPANIMLTREGQVKITDLGIARIENSSMTQTGVIMGTPAYMSPEQFMGQVVDPRTDIYSAGVLVYQMVTGERPFEGSISSIMHKVLNIDPPRPSALSTLAPATLDAVVARAMAKRPDDRFASAEAFAAALRRALTSAGTGGEDADATMRRPSPRRRSAAPVIAASVLALLAATGGAAWYAMALRTPGSHAAPPPADSGAPVAKTADAPAPRAAADPEVLFWDSVRASTNPAELRAYLARFPNGLYADLARARLAALPRPPTPVDALPAPPDPVAALPRPPAPVAALPAPPDPVAALSASMQGIPEPERAGIARGYLDDGPPRKALAISPDRKGSWRSHDWPTAAIAEQTTLEGCQAQYDSPCFLLASGSDIVPAPARGERPLMDMPRVRYAGTFDPAMIPVIGESVRVRPDVTGYATAPSPKAMAFHPWGRMFAASGATTETAAAEQALAACNADPGRKGRDGPCYLYSIGKRVVLPQRLTRPPDDPYSRIAAAVSLVPSGSYPTAYTELNDWKALAIHIESGRTSYWDRAETQELAAQLVLEACQQSNGSPCVLVAKGADLRTADPRTAPRVNMARLDYQGRYDPDQVPFLWPSQERRDYPALPGAKAMAVRPYLARFAIASGAATAAEAERRALADCNSDKAPFPCFLYASGDQVVLPERRTETTATVPAETATPRPQAVEVPAQSGAEEAEAALALTMSQWILIQRSLAVLGFPPGSMDGVPGDRTRQAIRQFQRGQAMPDTGYLQQQQLVTLLDQARAPLARAERQRAAVAAERARENEEARRAAVEQLRRKEATQRNRYDTLPPGAPAFCANETLTAEQAPYCQAAEDEQAHRAAPPAGVSGRFHTDHNGVRTYVPAQ